LTSGQRLKKTLWPVSLPKPRMCSSTVHPAVWERWPAPSTTRSTTIDPSREPRPPGPPWGA